MEMDLKVIFGFISLIFGAYFWLYNNTKTNLQQGLFRKEKIKLLETNTIEQTYKTSLKNLIAWLDNIYNSSTLIQNYSRHVTIAILYSFIIFIVFWVLGAEGKIGTFEPLEKINTTIKIRTLVFFIFNILFIYFVYSIKDKLIKYILKKTPKNLHKKNTLKQIIVFLPLLALLIPMILIIVVAYTLETGVGIEITVMTSILTLTLVGQIIIKSSSLILLLNVGGKTVLVQRLKDSFLKIIILYFFFFLSFPYFLKIVEIEPLDFILLVLTVISPILIIFIKKITLGLNLILIGLILIIIKLTESINLTYHTHIIGLFLIFLPLTNSLLDYISLKISKYMAEQIVQDSSFITILLHLLIDVILAIILLLILALFLYFSIEGLNYFTTESIPIKEMLNASFHDPFSIENGWITFMLLSTLVPTLVHVFIALGALFMNIIPAEKSLEKLNKYNKGQEALLESAAHYFTRILFMQIFFAFSIIGAIGYLIYLITHI